MFTGNDLPDLGGLIKTLALLALIGVIFGGYELFRLVAWLFNHLRFV